MSKASKLQKTVAARRLEAPPLFQCLAVFPHANADRVNEKNFE